MKQVSVSNYDADMDAPIENCEVRNEFGGYCQNKATKILVTKRALGYMPVCDKHADAYALKDGVNIIDVEKFKIDPQKYLYPNLAID